MKHSNTIARFCGHALMSLVTALLCLPIIPTAAIAAEADDAHGLTDDLVAQAKAQHAEQQEDIDQLVAGGTDPARARALVAAKRASSSVTTAKDARNLRKAAEDLPDSYFLTNLGEATEVKDQSPWGACWAFGGISSLESSVLKNLNAGNPASQNASTPALADLPSAYKKPTCPDYSEHHLVLFATATQTAETAGAQSGEGIKPRNSSASSLLGAGGNDYPTEALFTSRQGIVTESDEPYTYRNTSGEFEYASSYNAQFGSSVKSKDLSLTQEHRLHNSGVTVQDVSYLPAPALLDDDDEYAGYDPDATLAIKRAISENGAVATGIDSTAQPSDLGNDNPYLSKTTWSQYNYETDFGASSRAGINHEVCIVGWDDSYSAENFNSALATDAQTYGYPNNGNGAWLVKNSWGASDYFEHLGYSASYGDWGIPYVNGSGQTMYSGFFWVSYYDHSLYEGATSFVAADEDMNYGNIHQYDFLANATSYGGDAFNMKGGEIRTANVFTAGTDTSNTAFSQPDGEILKAVSAHTDYDNSHVDVDIYLLGEEEDIASALNVKTREPVAHASADEAYSGFHVIPLEHHVALAAGQRYAVVETITFEQNDSGSIITMYTLPLEFGYTASSGFSDGETAIAKANDGETYACLDGVTWQTPAELTDLYCDDGSNYGNAMIKVYSDSFEDNPSDLVNLEDVKMTTSADAVDGSGEHTVIYDGVSQAPLNVTLTYGHMQLKEGDDYTLTYAGDTVNAGSFTVTAKAVAGSGYTGEISRTITILPADLSDVVLNVSDRYYTGAPVEPQPKVIFNDNELVLGTDYSFSYRDNINVGEQATITMTGLGNFTGSVETHFKILPIDISDLELQIPDHHYTGSAIEPEILILAGDEQLVRDRDYKLVFTDNVNVGTASVTISGIGNYTGSCTAQFKIVASDVQPGSDTTPAVVIPTGEIAPVPGMSLSAGDAGYQVTSAASGSTTSGVVVYTKAPNKKSVTVPATITVQGASYKVAGIATGAFKASKIRTVTIGAGVSRIKAGAFNKSKATKVIVKSKLLKKATVKGCFKGSKVKTVQVKVGSKKLNKKFVKKYKKIFTKKITKTKAKKLTVK